MTGDRRNRIRQGVFLGIVALYLVILAASLPSLSAEARFFPIIILAAAGLLALVKALSIASPRLAAYFEPEMAASAETASSAAPSPRDRGAVSPVKAWSWVAGTLALMYLIGFLAGTAVAIFAFFRWIARDSWLVAGVVAGATVAFTYVIFVEALHLQLGFGFLGGLF